MINLLRSGVQNQLFSERERLKKLKCKMVKVKEKEKKKKYIYIYIYIHIYYTIVEIKKVSLSQSFKVSSITRYYCTGSQHYNKYWI